mmetsp:Transcript_15449/g.20526  ORF Transcript_15449/g.20526 Transcript_15449/m.20526 type:complete len:348 (+) Transcript_15449:1-1044(+)
MSFADHIYPDTFVKDTALELLRRRPRDEGQQQQSSKPWFLQVNFPGPHGPVMSTAAMAESVKNREWPAPLYATVDSKNKNTHVCPQQQRLSSLPPQPEFTGRCNYGAQIEHIDKLMSIIVNEGVRQTQDDPNAFILDDTLICVVGDHGEMLGDHNLSDKKKPWQSSIAVPMICAGSTVQRGQVYNSPVTILDLFGTFMDYAGVTVPETMSTRTLRPILDYYNHNNVADNGFLPVRTHVSSGLSSGKSDWRLVIKEINGTPYKLICCRGSDCGIPGPSTAKPKVEVVIYENGDDMEWSHLLYDVLADPLDLNPIHDLRQDLVMQLRPLLPTGWCPSPDVVSGGDAFIL